MDKITCPLMRFTSQFCHRAAQTEAEPLPEKTTPQDCASRVIGAVGDA